MPRLSLCMIVRNEERRLPCCLDSVQGLVGEVVVVDTGSSDRTPVVARDRGARVIEAVWRNDFSAARNIGLEHASGEWILVLDADEFLPEESRDPIAALIARAPRESYRLVICNPSVAGAPDVRTQMVRLFPRHPLVRFEQPIHEHVNLALRRAGIPIRDTTIEILHRGYADREELLRKQRRNTAIIEEAFQRDPQGNPHLRYYYAGAQFERNDWQRAAREYEECARITRESCTGLAQAARIRAAECHLRTGNATRALEHLPELPHPSHHPVALTLRAWIEFQRGNRDEARRWFEAILAVPDGPFVPPVALAPLKLRALGALADYWAAHGRKDLGVQILQLALEVQKKIVGTCDTAILHRYATILSGAPRHDALPVEDAASLAR